MSAFGTKRTFRDVRYLSAFGDKADISERIDHGYGSTGRAYGHPTRLAAECVWSPERLATITPRTTVASVKCRSRGPPTRKLTNLRMAVTAITFWRIPSAARKFLFVSWSQSKRTAAYSLLSIEALRRKASISHECDRTHTSLPVLHSKIVLATSGARRQTWHRNRIRSHSG